MKLNLNGRTCLLTGASSGIGAGIAKVLVQEGVKVAMVGRRVDRLKRLAGEIARDAGQSPIIVIGNITKDTLLTALWMRRSRGSDRSTFWSIARAVPGLWLGTIPTNSGKMPLR